MHQKNGMRQTFWSYSSHVYICIYAYVICIHKIWCISALFILIIFLCIKCVRITRFVIHRLEKITSDFPATSVSWRNRGPIKDFPYYYSLFPIISVLHIHTCVLIKLTPVMYSIHFSLSFMFFIFTHVYQFSWPLW